MKVFWGFCALVRLATATNFTIIGGQIFTPGLAIVDAPQPFTPLGGDFLQVALDVSGNGKLGLPPYPSNTPTGFFNITIYLSSYKTGLNLTISNGTATVQNGSLGVIMDQEPGSTVKHVNWNWPACLVGNGQPSGNSVRGTYNITIHQNFRVNGTNMYSKFDLPISVTNLITAADKRVACDTINNDLIAWETLQPATSVIAPANYPFAGGNNVQIPVNDPNGGQTTGLGGTKPGATSADGLGKAASFAPDVKFVGIGMCLALFMVRVM